MPRPAKPRKVGSHTADIMRKALKNIKNGMSVKKAAKHSGGPFTTLRLEIHLLLIYFLVKILIKNPKTAFCCKLYVFLPHSL